jgi:hypothetical protein
MGVPWLASPKIGRPRKCPEPNRDDLLREFVLSRFAGCPAEGEAFIRFAFAVEAAGGVARAREYLGLVERVGKP